MKKINDQLEAINHELAKYYKMLEYTNDTSASTNPWSIIIHIENLHNEKLRLQGFSENEIAEITEKAMNGEST
jgi:hypothetical protein